MPMVYPGVSDPTRTTYCTHVDIHVAPQVNPSHTDAGYTCYTVAPPYLPVVHTIRDLVVNHLEPTGVAWWVPHDMDVGAGDVLHCHVLRGVRR